MILLLALYAAAPWTPADEAALGSIRDRLGFSEGMRSLELGATPEEWREDQYCGSCHPEAFEEWSASLHASAGSDPLFLSGFADDPDLRCARCHAPLPEDQGIFARALRKKSHLEPALTDAPKAERPTGIGCAVCHVRDGVVLTARPVSTEEHATRVEPALSDGTMCGSCHQFRFERGHGDKATLSENVVQDTWREHLASGVKERCQDCHMSASRAFGHRMPGAHDEAYLAGALRVEPVLLADARYGLLLEPVGVGHRFPTGDLFRHLRVELERDGRFAVVAELGRSFVGERGPDGPTKRMSEDTTLAPSERRTLSLGGASGQRYRVVYVYTSERNLRLRPGAEAGATRVIAFGTFPVAP